MSCFDLPVDSEPDDWNTPAITRNGFSFKDNKFYVTVGYHTHTRKDAGELYALLTHTPPPPALTKAGKVAKRQPKDTHKDEEAHFYTAQLIHYGLKPLKTREPAKKNLLAAFGGADGKSLEVTKAVLELEVALREEWMELDAKMEERRELIRADEKEQMEYWLTKEKEQAEAQKKAEVATHMNAPPAKLAGGEVMKTPGTKKTATPQKKTSVVPMTLDDSDDEPEIVAINTNSKMNKTQMLEKITTLTESQAHGLLKKIFENVPAAEKLFQAEFTITTKGKSSGTKSNANGKKQGRTADPSEWIGEYHVTVPKLAENWEVAAGTKSLEVYPSSTSAHLWASFDFGIISGVMRSVGPPPQTLNQGIPFEWRGHEAGENVMTFQDDSNRGILTFLEGGKITAQMNSDLCSRFSFSGALRQRVGKPVPQKSAVQQRKEVKAWKKHWRGINWTNFEIANKARWGGWGGEEKDESAFESDTTAGLHKREHKLNLENFLEDPDSSEYEDLGDFGVFPVLGSSCKPVVGEWSGNH